MTNFPDPESFTPASKLEIFNAPGFKLPFESGSVRQLIGSIEKGESIEFRSVEVVYTSEEGIIDINKTYLQRDYVTDIISFRHDENPENQSIEGTLYCCAPRIDEQSVEFGTNPEAEFLRIIIHGLLHLAGYDDQTQQDKEQMTILEDHYLKTLKS